VTQNGCGALCPSFRRGCYGCYGPKELANAGSLSRTFAMGGREGVEVSRLFAGFTGWSAPFRAVVGEYGGPPGMTPAGQAALAREIAVRLNLRHLDRFLARMALAGP